MEGAGFQGLRDPPYPSDLELLEVLLLLYPERTCQSQVNPREIEGLRRTEEGGST